MMSLAFSWLMVSNGDLSAQVPFTSRRKTAREAPAHGGQSPRPHGITVPLPGSLLVRTP